MVQVANLLTRTTGREFDSLTFRTRKAIIEPMRFTECSQHCERIRFRPGHRVHTWVAQLVERRAHNPEIPGSNPGPATTRAASGLSSVEAVHSERELGDDLHGGLYKESEMIGERKYPHLWDEQIIRTGLSETGSVKALARRLECNYQTLYWIMGRLGIRSPRAQSTGRDLGRIRKDALALYKEGLSANEIVKRLGGISRGTICQWLYETDIPIRARNVYVKWKHNNSSTAEGRKRLALIYEIARLRLHEKKQWREIADRSGYTVTGCRLCFNTAYGKALARFVFLSGNDRNTNKRPYAEAMRAQGVDIATIARTLDEERITVEVWTKAVDAEYWKCPIP